MTHHKCYCGVFYACPYCDTPDGYICPTVNSDEDANLCSACYDKAVADMEAYYYDRGGDEDALSVSDEAASDPTKEPQ